MEGEVLLRTWYIRDASGDILTTYEENIDYGIPVKPVEMSVYGKGRIGLYSPDFDLTMYELTDHLGNVRAVIGDYVEAEHLATMESELLDQESDQDDGDGFINLEPVAGPLYANHTPSTVEVDGSLRTISEPNEVDRLNNRPGACLSQTR